MPRGLAVSASAERTEFCIYLDVTIHGSRRQSTYWTPCAAKTIPGHCRPSFLVMRLRSGWLGGIIEILTQISPSILPMSLLNLRPPRKVFIAFPYFAGLNCLNCPPSSSTCAGPRQLRAWMPFSCLFGPSLTECRKGKDGVIWAEAASKVQRRTRSAL
jgi:hypothetical protein